jgi:hypothetical protein
LNTIASPAALLPGPLVTRVRSRTEENVDSDRVAGLKVHPVFGWELEAARMFVHDATQAEIARWRAQEWSRIKGGR